MNILKGARTYLAGPVDNDAQARGWRRSIKEDLLDPFGIITYDPLVKPYWMSDNSKINPNLYFKYLYSGEVVKEQMVFDAMKEISAVCLAAAAAADFIVCHLPRSIFTMGTIVELDRASISNKPILFHCPEGVPSTWALNQFSSVETWKETFFNDWDSLHGHLRKIDSGRVKLDPIKWFSIAQAKDDLEIWKFTT